MWYKVKFKPRSSIVSELSADIFWGHIAWAIRYLFGEGKLREMLDRMAESVEYGIICTGLLPEENGREYIPALSVPIDPTEENAKKVKAVRFIPKDIVLKIRDNFSLKAYQSSLVNYVNEYKDENKLSMKESSVMRNVINRRTNTTTEGGLFSTGQLFFKNDVYLHSYIYSETFTKDEFADIFSYIAQTGYGADKSVGKGALELNSFEEIDGNAFKKEDKHNAFISLSLFAPENQEIDLHRSFYRVKSKIGRLGEEFAKNPLYYKRPLWFLESGGIFVPEESRFVYGGLLKNVYEHNENVVHYAVGVPLWVKWEQEEKK